MTKLPPLIPPRLSQQTQTPELFGFPCPLGLEPRLLRSVVRIAFNGSDLMRPRSPAAQKFVDILAEKIHHADVR